MTKKYKSPNDQLSAAKSIDATADYLKLLSLSEFGFVRIAVAENLNSTREILDQLTPNDVASHDDYNLAVALINNPKVSDSAKQRLNSLIGPNEHPDVEGIVFNKIGLIIKGVDAGKEIKVVYDPIAKCYFVNTANPDDPDFPWFDDWVENREQLIAYFEEGGVEVDWNYNKQNSTNGPETGV